MFYDDLISLLASAQRKLGGSTTNGRKIRMCLCENWQVYSLELTQDLTVSRFRVVGLRRFRDWLAWRILDAVGRLNRVN